MNFTRKKNITLMAALICELCMGIDYAWSVFQIPFARVLDCPEIRVSITYTIYAAAAVSAPLFSKLQQYIRPARLILIGAILYGSSVLSMGLTQSLPHLYLSYGVGVGCAHALLYPLLVTHMMKVFPKHQGMISGLLTATYGLGAVIIAPASAALTEALGVLPALRILGCLFLVVMCIVSFLVSDAPEERIPLQKEGMEGPDFQGKNWKAMVASPLFYYLVFLLIIGTGFGMMILSHASPILQENLKMTPQAASFIISIMSIGCVAGKFLWGALSDKIGCCATLFLLFLLSAISLLILAGVRPPLLYVAALVVAVACFGGFAAMIGPIAQDFFGRKYLSVNYCFMFVAMGIGGALGPRLMAVINESPQGSYEDAFFITGLACVVGLAMTAALTLYLIRRKRKRPGPGGRPSGK